MLKSTWRSKPTIIKFIPKDKTILFIDESGNNSKKAIKHSIESGKKGCNIRDDVYVLNGIAIDGNDHAILTSRFNKVKKKLSKDGVYNYPGKGELPINFHNVEIDGKKGPFKSLYPDFMEDINTVMEKTKYTQISAGINHYMYSNKNVSTDHDCLSILLGIILTRYATMLNEQNKDGIIVFESENKDADNKKLNYIKKVLKKGTKNHDSSFFSKIKAVYFRPKWLYLKNSWRTCPGLELADLTISPVRRLYHPEFIVIENKMYGFPNYGRDSINIVR